MKILLYAILGAGFLWLIAEGSAAPNSVSQFTCSEAEATSVSNGRLTYMAGEVQSPITGLGDCVSGLGSITDANFVGRDLPAGSPIFFQCISVSAGTLPPSAATSITISGYSDNANLGGGGSPIWTKTLSSCAATANTTKFTEYLTVDGTQGASPRAGIVRIFVLMQNTNTGTTYTCNSDNAGAETPPTGGTCTGTMNILGLARSNPGFANPNLTGPSPCASGCLTYTGGDTLTSTITSNASEYSAGTRETALVKSDGGPFNQFGSTFAVAIGANAQSSLIVGPPSTWPQTGALTSEWTETGFSSINLFSGLSYWSFQTTSVPVSMIVVSPNTATWATGDTLDRTLTPTSACSVVVHGLTTIVVNRGETATLATCDWRDARFGVPENGENANVWLQKAGDYRVATDFPSVADTFIAAGGVNTALVATTTATVTSGQNYHNMVESFDTNTLNDNVLENWGNTSGFFDVSATFNLSGLSIAKSSEGQNTSFFTIGTDLEFLENLPLRDQAGFALTGVSITCDKLDPFGGLLVSTVMGNTNGAGEAPEKQFQVEAPAGLWSFDCHGTSNGNSFDFVIRFFHSTAFSGDIDFELLWNTTQLSNGTSIVNLTAKFVQYNTTSDDLQCVQPDNASDIRFTVFTRNVASGAYDIKILDRQLKDNTINCHFARVFYTATSNLVNGSFGYARLNFTGKVVIASEAFLLPTNFTGNFTGNVTDLSALPQDISVVGAFLIFSILIFWLSYLGRNGIERVMATIAAIGLSMVADIAAYMHQADFTSGTASVFVIIAIALFLMLLAKLLYEGANIIGKGEVKTND